MRLLDRLERRGLTRRLPSRTDRRSHALRLTPVGQRTLKRAKALAARHEGRLIDELGVQRHNSIKDLLRDFDR